jgi:hypothetical protein
VRWAESSPARSGRRAACVRDARLDVADLEADQLGGGCAACLHRSSCARGQRLHRSVRRWDRLCSTRRPSRRILDVARGTAGELLNASTFLLFGAVLLGPALDELDWRISVYAVLSLTVVRMLPVVLALLGLRMRGATVALLGWFGPRGLGSIVFVLLLVEESGLAEGPLMLTVVTWTVALSVFAHGLTAWPGASRYADWYEAHTHHHASMPESVPVSTPRTRLAQVDGPIPRPEGSPDITPQA